MIWLLKIVNGLKGNVLITEKEVVLFGTNSRITKPFFFLFPLFDEPFFPGYKTFFKIKLFFPLIWKALTICKSPYYHDKGRYEKYENTGNGVNNKLTNLMN